MINSPDIVDQAALAAAETYSAVYQCARAAGASEASARTAAYQARTAAHAAVISAVINKGKAK